jgi:hypothetical protein
MNKNLIIIGLIGLILSGIFFGGFFVGKGCNKTAEKPDSIVTVVKVDTSAIVAKYYAEMQAELTAELKPIVKWKTIPGVNVNVDSIYAEAKRYWEEKLAGQSLNNYSFLAHGDSTFELFDSSGKSHGTLKVTGEYFSPLPLHPDGKIRLGAEAKLLTFNSNTVATETIVKKELPEWILGVGASLIYQDSKFEKQPFVNLQFNKKLWFLYFQTEVRQNVLFDNGNVKLIPQLNAQIAIGL